MAKSVWLFAVVAVLAVTSSSSALKCLRCNDCENQPSTTSTCLPGFSVCMKTNVGGTVRKSCAPSVVCKLEDVDRQSLNPLKNIKTIFSDLDMKKLLSGAVHARDKAVYCCETEFCNGSVDKRVNLGLLLLLPFVLYLFSC